MVKMKWIALAAAFSILIAVGCGSPSMESSTKAMVEIERISPDDAMKKVKTGEALLVCAYEDNICKTKLLEGSLLRSEFESKIKALPKTQEIIFYCK